MATKRFLRCNQCGLLTAPGTLFQVLLARAHAQPHDCPNCGSAAELQLTFAFGLNASHSECTVRECFVPRRLESWAGKDGSQVTFYPFLVILDRHERERAAWLPYWHLIVRGRNSVQKYGQWAPFMDFRLFADLLNQAEAKGYSSTVLSGPQAV